MAVSELGADVTTGALDLPRKLRMLVVLLGTLFAVFLARLLTSAFYIRDGDSQNDVAVFVVLPTIQAVLLVGLPFILARRMRHLAAFDCGWFRWSRSEFAWFWLMPLGVILSAAVTGLLVYLLGWRITTGVAYQHEGDPVWGVAMLVWLTAFSILVGPFAEEVFWRGYVQSTLTRLVPPALAIVIQAALFGLIHFRPVLGFMQASLFGLIFGLWCYRRKTLLPAILMHVAINGVALTNNWERWLELRQIKVTHDYAAEFLEFSKPVPYDPNDDARGEYIQACRLITDLPAELDNVRQSYPTQWTPDERARAQAWVAANAEAIRILEQGTRKTSYWPEYEFQDGIFSAAAPGYHTRMRLLVFALSMRAKLAAVEHSYEDARADVLTCCRLARHLGRCKDLITNLVGMEIRGAAAQTARLILYRERIDSTSLARWQQELQEFAARDDFVLDLTAERLRMLDAVQRLFTDDGQGGGHMPEYGFGPDGPTRSVFSDLANVVDSNTDDLRKLDRRTTTEALGPYYQAFERLTALPPWDYEQNAEGVKETIEKIASENLLIRMLSPNTRIGYIAARARVDLDSVITILAILRYKADKGRLPETLDALVAPGYLESVPRDPYGPGALTYRREGDDFVLYSHGADLDDDGGIPSRWGEGEQGGDQVFWPVR